MIHWTKSSFLSITVLYQRALSGLPANSCSAENVHLKLCSDPLRKKLGSVSLNLALAVPISLSKCWLRGNKWEFHQRHAMVSFTENVNWHIGRFWGREFAMLDIIGFVPTVPLEEPGGSWRLKHAFNLAWLATGEGRAGSPAGTWGSHRTLFSVWKGSCSFLPLLVELDSVYNDECQGLLLDF